MKSSNTVVTIVVIAAVLIAAYAIGLVIRQARTGNAPSEATEANEALIREGTAKLSHGPEAGRAKDTPQARTQLKEKHAQELEKMNAATDEQKEQFRQQVREGFRDRRGTTGTLSTQRPAAVRDPNTKSNSEKTGAEPNAAGQG